jgi:hypothetical protein
MSAFDPKADVRATRKRPAKTSKLLLHKNKIKTPAKLYSDPWHTCCFDEAKASVKLERCHVVT